MTTPEPRLTSLAHGGGCGCKLAPAVLRDILKGMPLAGPFADAYGAHHVLLACAAVMVVTSAASLAVPSIRNLRAEPRDGIPPHVPDSPADLGPAVTLPQ